VKRALRWAAVAAFAAAIFVESSTTGLGELAPSFAGADKAAHFVIYFLFAATVSWAFGGSRGAVRAAAWAAVIAALYGVTDEVHQHYVPGRAMSFYDWLADVSGAAAWIPAAWARARRKPTPPRPRQGS